MAVRIDLTESLTIHANCGPDGACCALRNRQDRPLSDQFREPRLEISYQPRLAGLWGTSRRRPLSSLSQINRKNVHQLQIAWKFHAEEEGGLETSPIATYMIDGKQYVVVSAGGGKHPKGSSGSVCVAFALP